MPNSPDVPWVVVSTVGVLWIGLANSEAEAWGAALGWGKPAEIAAEIEERKSNGWYAAPVFARWRDPSNTFKHIGEM